LPMMALHLHQKDAELDPVASRLAEILLQAALETLPEGAQAKERLPKVA
ncbi:LysR family transcriptional regulator, partial [Mesorhizobium sp. M2D.F.Ca.ET.223.01.1.1]